MNPAVIDSEPAAGRFGVNFHEPPIPENILVRVIRCALDRRWNDGIDADDRRHQACVALDEIFWRHPGGIDFLKFQTTGPDGN